MATLPEVGDAAMADAPLSPMSETSDSKQHKRKRSGSTRSSLSSSEQQLGMEQEIYSSNNSSIYSSTGLPRHQSSTHLGGSGASWGAPQPLDDFVLIGEFSELEGPVPLNTIPEMGGAQSEAAHFDKHQFVLRIMNMDYQVRRCVLSGQNGDLKTSAKA